MAGVRRRNGANGIVIDRQIRLAFPCPVKTSLLSVFGYNPAGFFPFFARLVLITGIGWLALGSVARAEDRDMVLEGLDGDVTTNEYQSFIDKLQYLPPPPTNNIGNLMVDERDGARIHGLQTFYAFTHDRRVLDMAVVWSDAFLHARNDPTNGRVMWTGKRELCWPNKATNDPIALYSGAENGDVIEHTVNTARLILESPDVWNLTAPPDQFGLGATYLDRTRTYVRECQRSAETTIVPWFVRNTKDGYRLYRSDAPDYVKLYNETGPLPWNQQQELVGALLRLAQCHRLLNDGNTNIAYYEKIATDAAAWFFASALPVSVSNRVCYLWSYGLPRDPASRPEVTYESDYDMFLFRTWQANLGPTRLQMQRLINTARFLMYLGTNRISGYINGTSDNNSSRHERRYFEYEWIELSVLDHEFYHLAANAILTSHEYYDNLAVEAAVLSSKHYWATHAPEPEVVDNAKVAPPPHPRLPPRWLSYYQRMPRPARLAMLLVASELLLVMAGLFRSGPAPGVRRSMALMWLAFGVTLPLGIMAAYRLPACQIPSAETFVKIGVILFYAGLVCRWTITLFCRSRRFPLIGAAHLLTILGYVLTFQNWVSGLIIFVPSCVVAVWRIRSQKPTAQN